MGLIFASYFVVMGLVGAMTPPDILTTYSWTRPFTDFMASFISQIDKVTALGIDADINWLNFSDVSCYLLVQILLIAEFKPEN